MKLGKDNAEGRVLDPLTLVRVTWTAFLQGGESLPLGNQVPR